MKQITNSLQVALFLLIMLLSISTVHAQKFGDIDMSRLQEKSHPKFPDASHAYIFKNSLVRYDLESRFPRIITERHYRIKIYKSEGVNEANVVIYIRRNKGDKEAVKDIKAECYNVVDGKKEKSKLSKNEVFTEEVNEYRTKVSFAIPNAREGSIIEFRYKINSPFVYSFPRHYFQENVPVDRSELVVNVPNYFSMSPTATGTIALNRKQENRTSFGAKVTQFTFEASDIPGIDEDKYVLDINDYRSSLKFELRSVSFPGQQVQNFTKDWNSICKNLMDNRNFGKAMEKKVKSANEFLNGITTLSETEKLNSIVDFINTNITWNGKISIYGTEKYDKLFEAKTGDVADINLLLINLCRKAGLAAYPIVTKYRFNGILNTTYPSLTELSYVFALVEVDGKQLTVDASSTYYKPGTLPLRALNIQGILIRNETNQIISLSNTNLNYHKIAGQYAINLEENRIEGSGKSTLKGYASVKARRKLKEEDDDEDQQDLIIDDDEDDEDDEEEYDQEDIYEYSETQGFEDKYGNITSKFDAQLYSPIERIGDEVYIDAFVTLEFDENPFLNEAREYPAFFNSKHYINHVSIIKIPEGYNVKSKPENKALKIVNDKGIFSYVINEMDGKIVANTTFKIDDDIFLANEYPSLYEFFNQVMIKQKEKIVLVKE